MMDSLSDRRSARMSTEFRYELIRGAITWVRSFQCSDCGSRFPALVRQLLVVVVSWRGFFVCISSTPVVCL